MASRAIALFGTDQAEPLMRTLRAGSLSLEFDNGALRYIRLGSIEVLRAIAFLVRDENWGTLAPKIENLRFDERGDGFSVTYRGTCSDAKRTLVYDARIAGESDGSLSFEVEAEPRTDVLTNRTGFIVLHPGGGRIRPSGKGAACRRTRRKHRLFPKPSTRDALSRTFARCRTRSHPV